MKLINYLILTISVAILSACNNDPDFNNFQLADTSWIQERTNDDGTIYQYEFQFEATTFKEIGVLIDGATNQQLGYNNFNEGTYKIIGDELHLTYTSVKYMQGEPYGELAELTEVSVEDIFFRNTKFGLEFAIGKTLLILWTIDCPPNAQCVDKMEFWKD